MADLSQTVTNSLNLFGPAPSDKWNAYNWNAFIWGEGTAPLVKVPFKVLSETVTLTDSTAKVPSRVIENTLSPTTSVTLENLTDGEGYYHVFPGGVTDGTDRVATTWSDGSSTSPSWSQGTASSTVWTGG